VLSDSAIHCVWTDRVTETAKRRDIYLQVFLTNLPVGSKRITPHYRVEIWGRIAVSTVLESVVHSQ
jgi:hypothetical protein